MQNVAGTRAPDWHKSDTVDSGSVLSAETKNAATSAKVNGVKSLGKASQLPTQHTPKSRPWAISKNIYERINRVSRAIGYAVWLGDSDSWLGMSLVLAARLSVDERAALAEDTERREAGADLETREGGEWADLLGRHEIRQAVLAYAEVGCALDDATAEVVAEMREQGGYQGIPIPLEALETRGGETIASGVANPLQTMPIIDRLFADSVAVKMGESKIGPSR